MDTQNLNKPELGRLAVEELHSSFLNHFADRGYTIKQSVELSAPVDKSVRFIGSHISVLKPYILLNTIPESGICMVQNSLRTRNVSKLFDTGSDPAYGSFFSSLGALVRPDKLYDLCDSSLQFIRETLPDVDEIRIRINSKDTDLIEACNDLPRVRLVYDEMPETYYEHTIGTKDITGRNFNISVPSVANGSYEDIGNIIVLEKDAQPLAVELAVGDITLLKQLKGLDHVLDTYDLVMSDSLDLPVKHKLSDAIIVCLVLAGEGIIPSARKNQTRLMRSYVKALALYKTVAGISYDELELVLQDAEVRCLPISTQAVSKVMSYVIDYDNQCISSKISNEEDIVVEALLKRYTIDEK